METWQEKYFNADGRLNRKPYLMRILVLNLIGLIPHLILFFIGGFALLDAASGFLTFYQFVIGIPGIMLMIRRLHDLNHSGWWWLLAFIPLLNLILVVYVFCFRGTVGSNRFGDDPLAKKSMIE